MRNLYLPGRLLSWGLSMFQYAGIIAVGGGDNRSSSHPDSKLIDTSSGIQWIIRKPHVCCVQLASDQSTKYILLIRDNTANMRVAMDGGLPLWKRKTNLTSPLLGGHSFIVKCNLASISTHSVIQVGETEKCYPCNNNLHLFLVSCLTK